MFIAELYDQFAAQPDYYKPHKHHDRLLNHIKCPDKVRGILRFLLSSWGVAKTDKPHELAELQK